MLPEVWANFLADFQNKRQPEKCRLPDAPRCSQKFERGLWQTSRIKGNQKNVDSQMIPNAPRSLSNLCLADFQNKKQPEKCRLPDAPRCSQKFEQIFWQTSRIKGNQKNVDSQMLPDVPRCSQMLPDAPRCSQMLPEAPRSSQMLPDAPRCCQMLMFFWHFAIKYWFLLRKARKC